MLQVPIDKILPVTEARANISKLVDDVEKGDIYVLTRGGKPAVCLVSIEYIKKLTENAKTSFTEEKSVKNISNKEKKVEPAVADINDNLPVVNEEKPDDVVSYTQAENEIVKSDTNNLIPDNYFEENKSVEPYEEEQKVPINLSTNN